MATITITETALHELKHIMQEQNMDPETTYVRMGVKGGGCSGFAWVFNLDENYDEVKDLLEEHGGLNVIMDRRSAMYLTGTTVDFVETLDKRGFKFENPDVKNKCGCGSSFSL